MSKESNFVFRVAVGSDGGTRSTVWRIWKNKDRDDIYIAPSGKTPEGNVAGIMKISLHGSRQCNFAQTSNYHKDKNEPNQSRKNKSWIREEGTADGWVTPISLLFISNFLSSAVSPAKDNVHIIPAPKAGGAVLINIIFTRIPQEQFRLNEDQTKLARIELSNGETCVVIAGAADDFDESSFRNAVVPLHERAKNVSPWNQPEGIKDENLRGAVLEFDDNTQTLRIVDIGKGFLETLPD